MAQNIGKLGIAGLVIIVVGAAMIAYGNFADRDEKKGPVRAETAEASENKDKNSSSQADASQNRMAENQPAAGKQTDKDNAKDGGVVAVVNGEDITRDVVQSFLTNMPGAVQKMDSERVFPVALEQVINATLIRQNADSSNVEETQAYQERLAEVKKQIKRSVFMERKLNEKVTEDRLRKAYDDYIKQKGKKQETRARHILVDDKEKAREIIAKLDDGAKFAELAKEYSTGPSSGRGGDLGYFTKDDMVKSFAETAFNIEPGNYSKEPVKTKFGWHVIKVEDRREQEPASFEEIRSTLASQERREVLNTMLDEWRSESEIETHIDMPKTLKKGNIPAIKGVGKTGAGARPGQ